MALVRRKAKLPTIRLLQVIGLILSLIFLAIFLRKLDAFTKTTAKHRRVKPGAPHLSPELLVQSNNNLRGPLNEEEEIIIEREERIQDASDTEQQTRRRRVALDLANLNNGQIGTMVLETDSSWAPIGVAHFWELIENNFYDQVRFFRVLPKFVAQFGIAADPETQKAWRTTVLIDDPVVVSNEVGTVTFATSGKNSRTTQLFINLNHNKHLDKEGFAPIGQIVEGLELIYEIQDEYREKPSQGKITQQGNAYLEENFPDLSYIQAIRVLD